MTSPLINPLPLEEYASHEVVTYSYSGGRWVLIKSYALVDAITLYSAAKEIGTEVYIFPPDLDPNNFNNLDVLLLVQEPSISVPVAESLV